MVNADFKVFVPNPENAIALDQRMRSELADSLDHICDASDGIVPFDAPKMHALISNIRSGARCRPSTFADYYDLAAALLDDAQDEAEAKFSDLTNAVMCAPGTIVAPLGSVLLGDQSERYRFMMERDSESDIGIILPTAEAAEKFIERYERGLSLMQAAAPELLGEFQALVSELLLVAGDKTKPLQFDGGSHYRLWGALFLNVDFHQSPEGVVEVIAHEAGHSFLFSHCIDENLVLNGREDRYKSPLRVEPRPMEGIYHATFVSARMHYAMSRLLNSGLLDSEARARTEAAMQEDIRNFNAGYGVVSEHALLTGTGRELIQGAAAYMRSAA